MVELLLDLIEEIVIDSMGDDLVILLVIFVG